MGAKTSVISSWIAYMGISDTALGRVRESESSLKTFGIYQDLKDNLDLLRVSRRHASNIVHLMRFDSRGRLAHELQSLWLGLVRFL